MDRAHAVVFGVWISGIVAVTGCHGTSRQQPQDGAKLDTQPTVVPGGGTAWLDETRWLGNPVQAENLTVWPIFAKSYPNLADFLTLNEAEERGLAEVREVGAAPGPAAQSLAGTRDPRQGPSSQAPGREQAEASQQAQVPVQEAQILDGQVVNDNQPSSRNSLAVQIGGSASVNTIVIENKGNLPILVCGGTIVKGGQQDRQIAQDLVIAPKAILPVDAYCVEAGRWTVSRDGLNTRGFFKSMNVFASKDVRLNAQYNSSQSQVWDSVNHVNSLAGNDPQTSTLLATIEETDKETLALRDRLEKAVRKHFDDLGSRGDKPVGFAYAVNGKPMTVRTFAHPRLLEKQLEPFVKTMCIEADLGQMESKTKGEKVYSSVAPAGEVLAMVRKINEAKEEMVSTSAANRIMVRRNEAGGNSNCYAEILLPSGAAPEEQGRASVPVTQDWTSK